MSVLVSAEGDCRQDDVETSTNTQHLHIALRTLSSCHLLWLNTLRTAVRHYWYIEVLQRVLPELKKLQHDSSELGTLLGQPAT